MGRNCCITIERQYGSGGREVARILSERLGIPCYGRELLAVTAADNGISIEELKKLDEKRTGSLLHDLVLYAFRFQNYNKMQEPFDINKEVSDTIRRLARKGPCIFIGRCADFALDGECDVLKLFIYASSMEKRKRRTVIATSRVPCPSRFTSASFVRSVSSRAFCLAVQMEVIALT